MLTLDQLAGLSTLLKRLATVRGLTVQEVQCMQVEGGRVLACANTNEEFTAIDKSLTAAGVGSDDWKDTLKSSFVLAYYYARPGREDSRPTAVPKLSRRDYWATTDLDNGLIGLEGIDGWGDDIQRLKKSKYFLTGVERRGRTSTYDRSVDGPVETQLKNGISAFDKRVAGGGFPSVSYTSPVEAAPADHLVLVKKEDSSTLHAEQTLLRKLAHHLKSGGTASDVNLAGVKKACSACEDVLHRFRNAYDAVYGKKLRFHGERAGPSRNAGEHVGQVELPEADDSESKYGQFRAKFVAPVAEETN